MELFDRYVRQVERRLPRKQRADVAAELHSLLVDALQGRMAERGLEVDEDSEDDQVAVLREMGPPAEVAGQYMPPHRYVVGPRVFNLYLIVVAATLGAMTLGYVILLGLALWGSENAWVEPLSTLGDLLPQYVNSLLAGLGSITVVFAILERVLPDSALQLDDDEEWDPRTLPAIEDRTEVKVNELIVEIVLCAVGLLILNLFPHWIGMTFGSVSGRETRWYVQIFALSQEFYTHYLPLVNVQLVLSILLNAVLLRQGRWQPVTRLADLALHLYGMYIQVRIVFGPLLFVDGDIAGLGNLLSYVLKFALGIALIVSVVETAKKLLLIFRTRSADQSHTAKLQNPANH